MGSFYAAGPVPPTPNGTSVDDATLGRVNRMTRPPVRRTAAATVAAGFVAAYAALGGLSGTALAATKVVFTTAQNTFDPKSVTINVGDTVSWTNNGGVGHTVTSTSDNWEKDNPIAVPQQSTSFRFTKAGTYTYQCSTHAPGMSGTVVVKAKPKPTPTPTRSTATPTSSPTPQPSTTSEPPEPSATPTSPPPASSPPPSPAPSASMPRPSFSPPGGQSSGTPYLGVGGLTPHPPTGRERGLPVLIAVVFLVGVVTAEVRTLLATPVDEAGGDGNPLIH